MAFHCTRDVHCATRCEYHPLLREAHLTAACGGEVWGAVTLDGVRQNAVWDRYGAAIRQSTARCARREGPPTKRLWIAGIATYWSPTSAPPSCELSLGAIRGGLRHDLRCSR